MLIFKLVSAVLLTGPCQGRDEEVLTPYWILNEGKALLRFTTVAASEAEI